MGRSVFILNSPRQAVMKAQFRKLRDEFGGKGLGIEGPFCDRGNAVDNLVGDIRRRTKSPTAASAAEEAMLALGPQNLPMCKETWLKVPFYFGYGLHHEIDSAGAVAACKTVNHQAGKARVVTPEELTLLSIAVLRRMGVSSHYAYMHLNENSPAGMLSRVVQSLGTGSPLPTPCILITEGNPQLVMPFPPFVVDYPNSRSLASLEVLDDNAVQSLIHIRLADSMRKMLMHEMVTKNPYATPEVCSMKAIHIGHSLFEGINLWTDSEVDESFALSNTLFGRDLELETARDIVAFNLLHDITCRHCHTREAMDTFLCDDARRTIMNVLDEADVADIHEATYVVDEAIASVSYHSCFQLFDSYMSLAAQMNYHIHPSSGCDEIKQNSN